MSYIVTSDMLSNVPEARVVRCRDMVDRFKEECDRPERMVYMVVKYGSYDKTIITPGTVGSEYHRTMGHRHIHGEGEMYRGISGNGKIVQILLDGTKSEQRIGADDRVDIDLYAYHYAVNVGDEPFVFTTILGNNVEKDYTMRG